MTRVHRSVTLSGIDAQCIEVEARVCGEEGKLRIVGLPDTACRESRERVLSAIVATGFARMGRSVIVSLAPADVRKEGSGLDLAVCLSVLKALGHLPDAKASASDPRQGLEHSIFLAELSLTGQLRPVRGTIAAAELARRMGVRLFLPDVSAPLAALVPGAQIVPAQSLLEVVEILAGRRQPRPVAAGGGDTHFQSASTEDFIDLRGQLSATRAALIAAAGGHGLLMIGPPGCGKSMIARRLPSILPPMNDEEIIEVARIRSVADAASEMPTRSRPFRAPHHTTSAPRIVGGGSPPRPGEVSLAHRGVLFLDELPEFSRDVIDALREPLENGFSVVSRVKGSATFPCRFQLVAAMNPCPCGYAGDPRVACSCDLPAARRYAGRVSGPVRDRIDLTIRLEAVRSGAFERGPARASAEIRAEVERARLVQHERSGQYAPLNALLSSAAIEKICAPDRHGALLIASAMDRFGLSARGRARTLAVARTIADLGGVARIQSEHIQEALGYRLDLTGLDRRG